MTLSVMTGHCLHAGACFASFNSAFCNHFYSDGFERHFEYILFAFLTLMFITTAVKFPI